jgi:hypothetical protein
MTAEYETITVQDMDALLRADKGWVKDTAHFGGRVKEIVYWYRTKADPRIIVKVYSSVDVRTGVSRVVGGDAIRVCAVRTDRATDTDGRPIVKNKRVNRVTGWQDRLQLRVVSTIKDAQKFSQRRG